MAERGRGHVGRAVVGVVVGGGLLAACASMPTSGPVLQEGRVEGGNPALYLPPDPPTPGDDQVSIVDGFIDAMGSYEPNYEVARDYLTPEARSSWEPSAGATVYSGNKPAMELLDDERVELTQTVTGTLGADGAYTPVASGQSRTFELRLEQVDGEWRIANPQPGLLISDFNFSAEFRPYDVYYFDPTYSVLVPDPVYVPVGTRSPATVLARALLAGPTEWLAPAVESAFSEGSELGVDAVPVRRGTARVQLSEEAGTAPPEVREQMAAQLAWTLTGVDGVDRVEITAGGTPVTVGDDPEVGINEFGDVDPSVSQGGLPVYAVSPAGVVRVEGAEVVPVPGPLGSEANVRELAVAPDGVEAAVIDAAGATLSAVPLDGGTTSTPLLQGDDLIEPAWDRNGTIWVLGLDDAERRLPRAIVDGKEVAVSVVGLGDRSVYRLEPSPDGARVAVVIGARAYVGLIIRDVDAPSEVQIANLRMLPVSGDAVDVAWRAAGDIAVLTEAGAEPGRDTPAPEVFEVPLDGTPSVARGPVEGAESIAGMPRNPLVVATSGGVLLRQDSGVQWVAIEDDLSSPAYPQR